MCLAFTTTPVEFIPSAFCEGSHLVVGKDHVGPQACKDQLDAPLLVRVDDSSDLAGRAHVDHVFALAEDGFEYLANLWRDGSRLRTPVLLSAILPADSLAPAKVVAASEGERAR